MGSRQDPWGREGEGRLLPLAQAENFQVPPQMTAFKPLFCNIGLERCPQAGSSFFFFFLLIDPLLFNIVCLVWFGSVVVVVWGFFFLAVVDFLFFLIKV